MTTPRVPGLGFPIVVSILSDLDFESFYRRADNPGFELSYGKAIDPRFELFVY